MQMPVRTVSLIAVCINAVCDNRGRIRGFDACFDPIFDFWVKERGKRVAFRMMSESMHSPSKYGTPAWGFE